MSDLIAIIGGGDELSQERKTRRYPLDQMLEDFLCVITAFMG